MVQFNMLFMLDKIRGRLRVKKFFKFGCLGIIAFFGLIVVAAIFVGGEDDGESKNSNQSSNSSKSSEGNKEEAATTVGIGQGLEVSDVIFTANSVSEETSIGDQYYSDEPAEGAIFKVVEVTIKNDGKEALTIDSSFFKLLADGAEYSPFQSLAIDDTFFLEQINPGLSKTGKVLFEVPTGISTAQLHVQTGFWGTETGTINIQ